MTEIWFYHLQRRSLDEALPALIEKSLERGWRVVVQARSEERLAALDQWLWTCSESSFIAHGRAADGDGDLQPVYLAAGAENPNGAALRIFIEGAEVADALDEAAYQRAILAFDGNQEDELTDARRQWKELKAKGFPLAYWRQDDAGGWTRQS